LYPQKHRDTGDRRKPPDAHTVPTAAKKITAIIAMLQQFGARGVVASLDVDGISTIETHFARIVKRPKLSESHRG
jgi:hypothetical protein